MDYILIFTEYCNNYFGGKDVNGSTAKTRLQRKTEFKWNLDEAINRAEENLKEQIELLRLLAFKDGYLDMAYLDKVFQNALRDQLRNFRNEQEQKSGLFD